MSLLTLMMIAVGLAMDAFAVSISSGLAMQRLHLKHVMRIALFFAAFQAIMPLIGWLAGMGVRAHLLQISKWVAFALLTGIGLKMIFESFKFKERGERQEDPTRLIVLILLSLATSLDALAAGVSFALLNVSIIRPAIIIGAVTFILSFAGVYIGDHFGHFFEQKIEIAGGIILIGIAIKTVIAA